MGTTPSYDLPYPEPTDRVRDGSTAIRALAEEVADALAFIEAKSTPSWAICPAASSALQSVSGSSVATFDGFTESGDFDFDGQNLTYNGLSSRWFHVDFECEATSAGAVTSTVKATLLVNGVAVVATGALQTFVGGGGTVAHQSRLRISTPVLLDVTTSIQVAIEASAPGGSFDKKQLRVASIGPRA